MICVSKLRYVHIQLQFILDCSRLMQKSTHFSIKDAYRFLKVEEYFANYFQWQKLGNVASYQYDHEHVTITLNFIRQNGKACAILIYFLQDDTFRVRFNPKKQASDYSTHNTKSIYMAQFGDVQRILDAKEFFERIFQENKQKKNISITTSKNSVPKMKFVVDLQPFTIKVYNLNNIKENPDIPPQLLVWKTAEIPFYFTSNGDDQYCIIQSVKKPPTSKFIGFGQQGGQSLSKNTAQVNYFNFDNMRYMCVYNEGPLDHREPLYHSQPIFFQYNAVPQIDYCHAIYVDNPGQILMDIGYLNSGRYMFGTRYGDLDYYFFLGDNTSNIIESFTSLVGRSRLKPRYCLGYQQGCYGYETRGDCQWAVKKHRDYKIPLDGLHVDVDIQNAYQTFTINTNRFYNPKEFFSNLRKKGVKCSTNITPVISCKDPNYKTYAQGLEKNYFILDHRYRPNDFQATHYQLYGDGNQKISNWEDNGNVQGFNSGKPYIGGVYYGKGQNQEQLGTPGHYADLSRQQVRKWWGKQYQYLFDCGLQMVWQDMTTPAIRETKGDMKGFPFRLMVGDDFYESQQHIYTPAIKIWNLYSYNLHKATYEGLNNLEGRNNRRNFIIGRGSYTGSHRFAGLWTGDNASDWDFLKMNVSQCLSLGMVGVVINGQDIGGFETSIIDGGKWANPELLIRWTAVGAFLPWFRNHYVRKGRKHFQEPFMYVEWFNSYRDGKLPQPEDLYRNVLPICKHYIQLRYRLMQVFYDCMFENTINGLPICRPLFLEFPKDKSLFNDKEIFLSNEFLVGKNILIAPVLKPQIINKINNHGKRDVYLPINCNWYCFANNSQPLGYKVEGGTTIRDFDANINIYGNHINYILPIFIREGAIIPTLQIQQYVGQLNQMGQPNPITFNIYPGDSGSYDTYLDDGVSRSSAKMGQQKFGGDEQAKSEYRHIHITHNKSKENSKIRQINIERKHDNYTPKYQKYFYIGILHDPNDTNIEKVNVGGKDITYISGGNPNALSNSLKESSQNAWYFNVDIRITFIKVFDEASIQIKVKYL